MCILEINVLIANCCFLQFDQIRHFVSGRCLTMERGKAITMTKCENNNKALTWKWLPLSMPQEYFKEMNIPEPRNRTVDALVGL